MRPEKIHESVAAEEEAAAAAVVPSFFKCPISLELMRDPVVLCTGQSYERSSIEPWLEAGNHTCPATMQTLASLELVPNHTLRRLIENWCEAHGGGGSSGALVRLLSTPSVPVAANTVARMLREVQSSVDPLPSLKNIRSVARESERNRKCIQESDAVSVLASVIGGALELRCKYSMQEEQERKKKKQQRVSFSLEACEEALAILALLEVGANRQRREQLLTQSSVTTLAWFLCKGSLDARVNAATVLAGIASETESSHSSSSSIGSMPGVLEALAKLLREEFYPKAIRAGLKALLTICIPRRNRIRVVEVGVVPLLIELLPDAKRSNVELALGVLELLCTTAEGRAAVANHALAMAALVHHLHTVSNLATELSVAILWSVCKASPACLVAALQSGAFAALLLLLQLDCSQRTRLKARELLKTLRSPWMETLCGVSSQLETITAL
jgi:hypothetical protein